MVAADQDRPLSKFVNSIANSAMRSYLAKNGTTSYLPNRDTFTSHGRRIITSQQTGGRGWSNPGYHSSYALLTLRLSITTSSGNRR